MRNAVLPATWYQQFDADYRLATPAEGYGGWRTARIEVDLDRTALVVMHAWDCGDPEELVGWRRCVEYIPRAEAIVRERFPRLLGAARQAGIAVFHVVGGGDYYRDLPGYRRARQLAGPPETGADAIPEDPMLARLREFRRRYVFMGRHNEPDVEAGFAALDFPPEARPVGREGVAENGAQLLALCREAGVSHLLYCGFALNWCLLLSPGGMAEMSRYGLLCSAVREATTAVENRESAAGEAHKEEALWRVALAYGFIFGQQDLEEAFAQLPPR